MTTILVTGSADGLGRLTAEALLDRGHDVVVHGRSEARAATLQDLGDRGARVVVADLADRDAVVALARRLDAEVDLDAVVHNAGVYTGTAVMPVNVVAPYLLTALLPRPSRLVYLSSGLHRGGHARLDDVDWAGRRPGSYPDSKLYVAALAAAVARRRPHVASHAVDPGWVPTRMGGAGAPDDLELGHRTQEWLVTTDDAAAAAGGAGGYWFHGERQQPHPAVDDTDVQDRLLAVLARETGVTLD